MCKPDAVRRGLVGEVVSRLERKGLTLVAAELHALDPSSEEDWAAAVDRAEDIIGREHVRWRAARQVESDDIKPRR